MSLVLSLACVLFVLTAPRFGHSPKKFAAGLYVKGTAKYSAPCLLICFFCWPYSCVTPSSTCYWSCPLRRFDGMCSRAAKQNYVSCFSVLALMYVCRSPQIIFLVKLLTNVFSRSILSLPRFFLRLTESCHCQVQHISCTELISPSIPFYHSGRYQTICAILFFFETFWASCLMIILWSLSFSLLCCHVHLCAHGIILNDE